MVDLIRSARHAAVGGLKRVLQGQTRQMTSFAAKLGGGDNWLKLELSVAHLPRGAHAIYKHILFYWYPTFFALKNPPRPKN